MDKNFSLNNIDLNLDNNIQNKCLSKIDHIIYNNMDEKMSSNRLIFFHPTLNKLFETPEIGKCAINPSNNNDNMIIIDDINNANTESINNVINYFYYPITSNNFLKIVYSIRDLNELFIFLTNNINQYFNQTLIRILNSSWKEFNINIIDNIDIYAKINIIILKKILNDYSLNYDDDKIVEKIIKIIKTIYKKYNNKDIVYYDKLKKRI